MSSQLEFLEFTTAAEAAPPSVVAPSPKLHRVLHVINGEHYAGAERVQDLLALNLPEFGYAAGFACTRLDKFAAARVAQQIPLYAATMRHKFDLRPAWHLARVIRDEGYELVHSHTARSALIGSLAAKLAGVPLVHHLHSPAARDTTRYWNNRLNAIVERFALRHAAALVSVSQSLANYAESAGFPTEQLHVVTNGVPVVGPLVDRHEPGPQWTLGTVALFRPRKGLEVLIESMARLVTAGCDVRLRAVGAFETESYRREVMQRVERLQLASRIEWRGFRRDVTTELQAMDLFVLPSLFGEGMPMVILEAMAAGVPVAATRVEGVPEIIRDQIDGVLSDANDASSLSEAIRRVIEGRCSWTQLRASAHQRHADHFSARRMAERLAKIYDRVLHLSSDTSVEPS